ncbi:unnamed protein product [Amoebophrya sp. A25]|nr:unnamed protein product [Amoebophrya sp. A25]|eukprot:GSA25T00005098001.1
MDARSVGASFLFPTEVSQAKERTRLDGGLELAAESHDEYHDAEDDVDMQTHEAGVGAQSNTFRPPDRKQPTEASSSEILSADTKGMPRAVGPEGEAGSEGGTHDEKCSAASTAINSDIASTNMTISSECTNNSGATLSIDTASGSLTAAIRHEDVEMSSTGVGLSSSSNSRSRTTGGAGAGDPNEHELAAASVLSGGAPSRAIRGQGAGKSASGEHFPRPIRKGATKMQVRNESNLRSDTLQQRAAAMNGHYGNVTAGDTRRNSANDPCQSRNEKGKKSRGFQFWGSPSFGGSSSSMSAGFSAGKRMRYAKAVENQDPTTLRALTRRRREVAKQLRCLPVALLATQYFVELWLRGQVVEALEFLQTDVAQLRTVFASRSSASTGPSSSKFESGRKGGQQEEHKLVALSCLDEACALLAYRTMDLMSPRVRSLLDPSRRALTADLVNARCVEILLCALPDSLNCSLTTKALTGGSPTRVDAVALLDNRHLSLADAFETFVNQAPSHLENGASSNGITNSASGGLAGGGAAHRNIVQSTDASSAAQLENGEAAAEHAATATPQTNSSSGGMLSPAGAKSFLQKVVGRGSAVLGVFDPRTSMSGTARQGGTSRGDTKGAGPSASNGTGQGGDVALSSSQAVILADVDVDCIPVSHMVPLYWTPLHVLLRHLYAARKAAKPDANSGPFPCIRTLCLGG